MNEYFQTKSKTLAMALNYIGYSYYKFCDNGITVYSFKVDKKFYDKLDKINEIKFSR